MQHYKFLGEWDFLLSSDLRGLSEIPTPVHTCDLFLLQKRVPSFLGNALCEPRWIF